MGWFPLRPWKPGGHFTKKPKYTPKLIDDSVNKYLNNQIMNKPSETELSKTKENSKYLKLSFIEKYLNSLKTNYKID